VIVATGPLTSPALASALKELTGEEHLAFFDAIAPIVYRNSIDMSVAWLQSRYDKKGPGGTGSDYINCPLTQEQYYAFVEALRTGAKTEFKDWETSTPYFSGCLPIEVMAERGVETLRHGPMKPRGLTNAHKPQEKPYAVVQLRQDNKLGTLYNMVGFQTKLKYGEQQRIFQSIPGLEKAEFARLGGLHRNTFLNSPQVLDESLRLKSDPRLRFAGQITGVEGYVESAATGLIAGRLAAAERRREKFELPPPESAHGALINHITGGHIETTDAKGKSFQPMNINFGLFPPVKVLKMPDGKRLRGRELQVARKRAYTTRAVLCFEQWLGQRSMAAE
jgi:methylenetetrahydrofolate--tRNA-(uracil-5-)-methyltransferase